LVKPVEQWKIAQPWSLGVDGHEAGPCAAKPSASWFVVAGKEPLWLKKQSAYTHFVFESRTLNRSI
jgi:hypothetical protein